MVFFRFYLKLANFDLETKQILKENNVVELARSQVKMVRLGVDILAVFETIKKKYDGILGKAYKGEKSFKKEHRKVVRGFVTRVNEC